MVFTYVHPHGSMLSPQTITGVKRGIPRVTQIPSSSRNFNPIAGLAQSNALLKVTTSMLFLSPVPHQVASGKEKPAPLRRFHRYGRYRGRRRRTHYPKDPAHVWW